MTPHWSAHGSAHGSLWGQAARARAGEQGFACIIHCSRWKDWVLCPQARTPPPLTRSSPVIRGQIKATMRYCLAPTRKADNTCG